MRYSADDFADYGPDDPAYAVWANYAEHAGSLAGKGCACNEETDFDAGLATYERFKAAYPGCDITLYNTHGGYTVYQMDRQLYQPGGFA